MNTATALRPENVQDAVWEASLKRSTRYLARYNAMYEGKNMGLEHCAKTVGTFLQDDLKKKKGE